MLSQAGPALAAGRLPDFIHAVDDIAPARGGLLDAAGQLGAVRLCFHAPETALLFLAAQFAFAQALHLAGQFIAFIGRFFLLLTGLVDIEYDSFPCVFARELLPPVRLLGLCLRQRLSATKAPGQRRLVPGAALRTLHENLQNQSCT